MAQGFQIVMKSLRKENGKLRQIQTTLPWVLESPGYVFYCFLYVIWKHLHNDSVTRSGHMSKHDIHMADWKQSSAVAVFIVWLHIA